MRAEILSVGTELLLGQITDTNAQYLAQVLAEHGVDLFYKQTVGDNTTRRAPNRSPSGIDYVVLNGSVVVQHGKFDRAARAGRVLRRG